MKLIKCFKQALNMVLHSRLRSWLTILGIVIGVAAVVAIMSIGNALQQNLNSQLGSLGGDIITITAGASRGFNVFGPGGGGSSAGAAAATEEEPELGRLDVQVLRSMPDISLIDTNIRGNVDVTYFGKSGSVSLSGVDQKIWSQITTLEIRDGRMLDAADQNVVVIGARLADTYFGKELGINQMINIEGNAFRVVGILKDENTNVYMPISMAYQVLDDKKIDVYDSIIVKIKNEEDLDIVINKTNDKLMIARHVTARDKDFSITSSKQQQQARSEIASSLNSFLLAIAAVSLIVGAVGIANSMFTSVLEKTKEIGIMKAIGARNKDIMTIFLLNAALIGLVGGILGVLFGTMLSSALPALMGQGGILRGGTLVTLDSVILALSVSIIIGILSGVIPAYQASKLRPVDALRYD